MATIDNALRTNLHQVLREKLTVDAADTLMDHLPPGGWSDVATKTDIAELKAETQSEFALVRKDLQLLEARLIEKLDKTIIKQNRWMIGILGSLVVAMIIALVR